MKKNPLFLLPLLLLSLIILSACGNAQPVATLNGTSWKLISFGPVANPTLAVSDSKASLLFDNQGRMSGNAGCNGFSGDYKYANGQLMPGTLMSTMMACSDSLMQQESAMLETLNGTLKIEIDKDTLRIYSADGQSLLTFSRQ